MNTNSISRRDFINRTAAGATAFALTPVTSLLASPAVSPWPKDAGKHRFYMIGHGHIDPVWLWPWTEGVAVVHSTFRSALDRMKETSDLVFTASSAQFYQWVADNDPGMLTEIRQRIAEGRWNVVGGWWVEPDMNLPSGEAMVRQGLYGQLTLEKLVGKRAVVGFNPDSFGHPGTLPQIIRLQGMENYVFMRPAPHEKTIPADLFWWEGPDGSKVLTYRIQHSYNESRDVNRRINDVLKIAKEQPMMDFMAFFGVGDHGGGPTKINIESINGLKTEKGAPTVFYSSVDRYFEDVRAKGLNLPTVKDDLQHHAVGCYSAESAIKKNNRLSEAALVTAEKIATVGAVIWKAHYPKERFTDAWKQILFLQFHDSLAGSSLAVHSKDALEGHQYALNIAHTAAALAIQKLEWQIPSEDPESEYLVAFNPHAWEVTANMEYDLNHIPSPQVTDDRGQSLPAQYIQAQSVTGRRRILFNATLPPLGYRQFRIRKGEATPAESKVSADANRLENEFYRITFSPNGEIGIYDKEAGRDVFKGGATGCKGVIIDDPSDTWSHDVRDFTKNAPTEYNYVTKGEIGAFGKAKTIVLEKGALRAGVRVQSAWGNSDMTVDWLLTSGSRQIEALVSLNWHERLKMLKFSFPVDVESPVPTYETPYGVIVRKPNGEEDPGQRWIDVTGKRGADSYGLTVLNDAKYGYNVQENDLRITVTRSAPYAHHGPSPLSKLAPDTEVLWMDQGIQTLRLLLVPHKGSWQDINVPRMAEEFIAPPVITYQGIHRGTMPKSASFLAINTPNVIVSAIKQSETGSDLVIRLVETLGKAAAPVLRFPSVNISWRGNIKPFEIQTLRVNPQTGNIKEVNLLEE
ncbi:MAG: twin-arginine translocation signal domain-containing protein [Tannerella sp.]|jgi:alpha-mannosidase|nr:twin-arginine translocation signal domain-containing protein [Tannerella sp.]